MSSKMVVIHSSSNIPITTITLPSPSMKNSSPFLPLAKSLTRLGKLWPNSMRINLKHVPCNSRKIPPWALEVRVQSLNTSTLWKSLPTSLPSSTPCFEQQSHSSYLKWYGTQIQGDSRVDSCSWIIVEVWRDPRPAHWLQKLHSLTEDSIDIAPGGQH